MEKQKNRKHVTLLAIMLLITIGSAHADYETGLIDYFYYPESATGILGNCTPTLLMGTQTSEGWTFNGQQRIEYDCSLRNATTIMIWYNTTTGYHALMSQMPPHTGEIKGDFMIASNISLNRYTTINKQNVTAITGYGAYQTKHQMALATYENSHINLTINNSKTTSTGTNDDGFGGGTNKLTIGAIRANGPLVQNYTGTIISIAIWKRELTHQEKTDLYTSGSGYKLPLLRSETYTPSYDGGTNITNRTATFSCNPSGYAGNVKVNYTIHNTRDNTHKPSRANATNITWNNGDFDDPINITCTICDNISCENTTSTTIISQGNIEHYFKILYTTPWGTITRPKTTWVNHSKTDTTTGYNTIAASQIINGTHNYTETIRFQDLLGAYQTNNYTVPHNVTWNWTTISVEPNKLTINFYNRTNLNYTSGLITDGNVSKNFTQTQQLQYALTNFTNPYVNTYFGMKKQQNWTQYYEFNNNYSAVTENIELLDNANWQIWFKTLTGDTELKGVRIRVMQAKSSLDGTWQTSQLIGQRYTNQQGETMFWNDENSVMYVLAWKEGYEPQEFIFPVGDSSHTQDDPYNIYMKQSTWGATDNALIYGPKTTRNKSLDLNFTYWAPFGAYDTPTYTTAYRQSQGLAPVSITEYSVWQNRRYFTLRSGTDFATTDGNITLYVTENYPTTTTHQYTIEHITRTQNNILGLAGVSAQYLIVLILIASILISGAISKIIKTPTSGATTWDAMTVIMTLINPAFAWVVTVTVIKYVMRWIGKIITQD